MSASIRKSNLILFKYNLLSRSTNLILSPPFKLPQAPFTLLRIHMKADKKVSVFTLRSHCSTLKTETFENAKRSVNTEKTKTDTFENASNYNNTTKCLARANFDKVSTLLSHSRLI